MEQVGIIYNIRFEFDRYFKLNTAKKTNLNMYSFWQILGFYIG